MTASISAIEAGVVERQQPALRLLEVRLRNAAMLLDASASGHEVRAAHRALDDAERALSELVHDDWDQSTVALLREARHILSSHLLAASACQGADVAPLVTARVLRRAAESTRRLVGRCATGAAIEGRSVPIH